MTLLLDSQVLLWMIYSPERLTPKALSLTNDPSNILLVSHASLWELLAKIGRGKLLLAGTSVEATMQQIIALGVTLIPVVLDDILKAALLPPHHHDPFDRVLLAQAMIRDIPILSSDGMFPRYDVQIIWD